MNHWQIIRIVLALCGIFAAGVVTGRFTAPAPAVLPPAAEASKGGPVVLDTGDGMAVNSAQVIRYYTKQLNLTVKQRAEVIPVIRRTMTEMQKTDPGSQVRLDLLRKMVATIRTSLSGPQLQQLDDIAAEMEKEWIQRPAQEANGSAPAPK